ncbi:MAG: hypothetical protein RIB67_01805 [Miltoncostaeaceae bacterium]
MTTRTRSQPGPHSVVLNGLSIRFHRTLRVPGDGRVSALPPSLGHFTLHPVGQFASRVPDDWRERGGWFICMHRREALWLSFSPLGGPVALKVGVGEVNALTGDPWGPELHDDEQDYLVAPPQPWLDGIVDEDGEVRQFVATTPGQGHTVEGQIAGAETAGGIQLRAYAAREGAIAPSPPRTRPWESPGDGVVAYSAPMMAPEPVASPAPGSPMGIAAGGGIRQEIYTDPHGVGAWDQRTATEVVVHIIDPAGYRHITGRPAPPSPVTLESYLAAGLPWFDLDDEHLPAQPGSETLKGVASLDELESGMDAGASAEEW